MYIVLALVEPYLLVILVVSLGVACGDAPGAICFVALQVFERLSPDAVNDWEQLRVVCHGVLIRSAGSPKREAFAGRKAGCRDLQK